MAMEIPGDLIKQLQISLRDEAKLSSYDPADASLPSFAAVLDGDDSPPSSPRCRRCNGSLLRGERSVFCVFCGQSLPSGGEAPPPLRFTATSGYRWFLHSLALSGSETVAPSIEAIEWKRGQNTPEEMLPLSDLLDLEIRWHADPDSDETLERKKSPLNLAGFDFDDFLAEGSEDSVSGTSKVYSAPKKDVDAAEHNASQSQENLSLFPNITPSITAASSVEDSGWEADFQSADSNTHQEFPGTSVSFERSSKALNTTAGPGFDSGTDLFDGKTKQKDDKTYVSDTDSWFQGSTQSNSTKADTSTIADFNVGKVETADSSSVLNVDCAQTDKWQPTGAEKSDSKVIDEDDDSIDAWNDFHSTSTVKEASKGTSNQTADCVKSVEGINDDYFSEWASGFQSVASKTQQEEFKSFDSFVGSSVDLSAHMDKVFESGENLGGGQAKNDATSSPSNSSNWFQDDPWSNSALGMSHQPEQYKVNANVNDKETLWNQSISSAVVSGKMQEGQQLTNDDVEPNNKTILDDNDPFGPWNDLRISNSVPNVSQGYQKETVDHVTSTEEKTVDSSSDWETEFQSAANSKTHKEVSKSRDAFMGTPVDLSAHMDSVFGIAEDSIDVKEKNAAASLSDASDWFQNDLWHQSNSGLNSQAKQHNETKVSDTNVEAQNSASMSTNWFSDDQWQTISDKAPDYVTSNKDDDSIDDWNDFKSSTSKGASDGLRMHSANLTNLSGWSSNTDQFNLEVKDGGVLKSVNSSSLQNVDQIEDQQWQTSRAKTVEVTDENDDSFDDWNDFTGSNSNPSAGSSKQTTNQTQPSFEASEINLLSTNSGQMNNDFSTFSQLDLFSGASVNQSGSTKVDITESEASISDRILSSNFGVAGVTNDRNSPEATTAASTDDVEMVMSQMHDLSFMLKSSLSVPPKAD